MLLYDVFDPAPRADKVVEFHHGPASHEPARVHAQHLGPVRLRTQRVEPTGLPGLGREPRLDDHDTVRCEVEGERSKRRAKLLLRAKVADR